MKPAKSGHFTVWNRYIVSLHKQLSLICYTLKQENSEHSIFKRKYLVLQFKKKS